MKRIVQLTEYNNASGLPSVHSIAVELNFDSQAGHEFVVGDNMVAKSASAEPKYAIAVGFQKVGSKYMVLTNCNSTVEEDNYRKPKATELDRFSKYPDTVVLRTHLNKKNKYIAGAGTRKKHRWADKDPKKLDKDLIMRTNIGFPHMHVDDFLKVYGNEYVLIDAIAHQDYRNYGMTCNIGSYISVKNRYSNRRHNSGGYRQSQFINDEHVWSRHLSDPMFENKKMLGGSFLSGRFMMEEKPYNFENFFNDYYDERDPIYVKFEPDEYYKTYESERMWYDPVSAIVRVERISGNDTFISQFGYICSMRAYRRIEGSAYSRWLMNII